MIEKHAASQPFSMNAPLRRRVTLPGSGIELALLDWGGPGPLALLHHANGFCAAVWGPVAEGLRELFRVVAIDARGHGDSAKPEGPDAYAWSRYAEDVLGVAEWCVAEQGQPRVALGIGHSFGGTALIGAAARRPELFERLLLVDPVIPARGVAGRSQSRSSGNRLADYARRRRAVWPSRAAVLEAWRGKDFFAEWDPRALALYVEAGFRDRPDGSVELACPGEVEAAIFEGGGAYAQPFEDARRVRAPTCILWATRGNFAREVYEDLAATLPDGRVEDVPAGHLVPMTHPGLVVEAALRFAGEEADSGVGLLAASRRRAESPG
jgi:pimeloyl-ACP methyl ester carboxylesterase